MNACPICKAHQWFIESQWSHILEIENFNVICKLCGHRGPVSTDRRGAMEAWNGRVIHEQETPTTQT